MALPNDSQPPRTTSDARRTRWALASAVVLVLFALYLIYPDNDDGTAENLPSPATQTQP